MTPQELLSAANCLECLTPGQLPYIQAYLLNSIAEGGGAGPHNLLSATHPDTLPGSVARGSLILGNATPKWAALPIGAANRLLRSDGTDASWAQASLTTDVSGVLPVANGGTGTSTAFTAGSVIFAGAAGAYSQDNANFFFDNTNNRLGLVTASPSYTLHVLGPGSFQYGFAAGALILGADLNATTISVNARKIGRVNMVSYDGGATNTFLFGGDLQAGTNDVYFGGVPAGSQYASTGLHFVTGATQTTTGGTERLTIDNAGGVGIGVTSPTAALHLKAGTATASTAPLKFISGPLLTTPEVGAVGFLTDDLYFTITTGAARKRLLMADPSGGLTATRVPFATTNGRLTDDAGMTFGASLLTVPNLTIASAGVLQLGNAAVAGTVVPTHTVTLKDSTGTTYRVPCLV